MAFNGAGDNSDSLLMSTLGDRCVCNRLLPSRRRVADNASKLFGQIFDALHQCADNTEVMPAMFADDRFVFDLFSAKRAFHGKPSFANALADVSHHRQSTN